MPDPPEGWREDWSGHHNWISQRGSLFRIDDGISDRQNIEFTK